IDRLRSKEPACEPVAPDVTIRLRDGRIGRHEGTLKRRLSRANQVNYVTMADAETGRKLDRLCEVLEDFGSIRVGDFINQNPSIDESPTGELLGILNHYRVLHLSAPGTDQGGTPARSW